MTTYVRQLPNGVEAYMDTESQGRSRDGLILLNEDEFNGIASRIPDIRSFNYEKDERNRYVFSPEDFREFAEASGYVEKE